MSELADDDVTITEVPEEATPDVEVADEELSTDEEAEKVDESDEVVVTLGEEAPPADEEEEKKPGILNDVRKRYREAQRRIHELEQRIQVQQKEAPVELGEEPTLEGVDYDADEYKNRLLAWSDKKRVIEDQNAKLRAEQEATQLAFNQRMTSYNESKSKLQSKVQDYEEAEHEIVKDFSTIQQGILVDCAADSALFAYALGKNTAKRKELAAIKNPAKFSYELGKLETQLKVTPKKSPPPPESRVRSGSASTAGTLDSKLDRLRADAERSGDMTKVLEYKRNLRKK